MAIVKDLRIAKADPKFEDLQVGTVFQYGLSHFIKTETFDGCCAVNLHTGELIDLPSKTQVTVKVHIEITND